LAPNAGAFGFFILWERFGGTMSRIKFFIDGFNVYHALEREASYHKYKWLDYSKLVSLFVRRQDQIVEVLYFTALANWDVQKVNRHKLFISALKFKGVKVILVPAVEAVKLLFPAKKVGVVIPINWRAALLKQVCDFHMKMKEKH
jgi:hypothetical protein